MRILMQKLTIFLLLMIHTSLTLADPPKNFYQVDVIIFAHTDSSLPQPDPLFSLKIDHATPLDKYTKESNYSLLPSSDSHLLQEYYSLRQKPQYQILAHYSWTQPHKGKKKLLLKSPAVNGWQMEGVISLARNQYYFLDTELQISKDNHPGFVFAKKERLKANNLYYLDHAGAGMLIRIHT